MPIENLLNKPKRVVASTPEEIDKDVNLIIANLGSSHRDFVHASETYNSDFFRDESPEFTRALVRALKAKYQGYSNSYWDKLSSPLDNTVES